MKNSKERRAHEIRKRVDIHSKITGILVCVAFAGVIVAASLGSIMA